MSWNYYIPYPKIREIIGNGNHSQGFGEMSLPPMRKYSAKCTNENCKDFGKTVYRQRDIKADISRRKSFVHWICFSCKREVEVFNEGNS